MRQISNVLMLVVITVPLSGLTASAKPGPAIADHDNPAKLAQVSVTSDFLTAKDSTYYFIIRLPERNGNRFAKLSFTDLNVEKGVEPIRFDLARSKAFLGTPDAIGRALSIADIWVDETGVIWLEFNPSLPPKTTLTVALKTRDLPSRASYEYGIAAYPDSNRPVAVFVGNGRLRIGQ